MKKTSGRRSKGTNGRAEIQVWKLLFTFNDGHLVYDHVISFFDVMDTNFAVLPDSLGFYLFGLVFDEVNVLAFFYIHSLVGLWERHC